MPKQMSKADALKELDFYQRRNSLLDAALQLSMTEEAAATETARSGSRRYTFRLYGATRACGGIVVQTFHCKGQTASVSAYYLDDLDRSYRSIMDPSAEAAALREAVGRLRAQRDRLVDEHYKARHAAAVARAA